MPEVEPLIRIARELAIDLYARCGEALDAGVPVERAHGHYFRRTSDLLDEAEAQALLATGGSVEAIAAIEACIDALAELATGIARELAQAAGDEPDV